MGIRSWSTSTPSRPSCRGIRCSSSKAPKSRWPGKRPDLEPRRRDTGVDRLSPTGSAVGRALVIEPVLRRAAAHAAASERSSAAKLDEASGLARAIDLDVAQAGIVMLRALHSATYLSKGKVEEIAGLVKTFEAGIVVMDCALSPA